MIIKTNKINGSERCHEKKKEMQRAHNLEFWKALDHKMNKRTNEEIRQEVESIGSHWNHRYAIRFVWRLLGPKSPNPSAGGPCICLQNKSVWQKKSITYTLQTEGPRRFLWDTKENHWETITDNLKHSFYCVLVKNLKRYGSQHSSMIFLYYTTLTDYKKYALEQSLASQKFHICAISVVSAFPQ